MSSKNLTPTMAKAVAIIPARLASTRLPGKLLQNLAGQTVITRVYNQVAASGLFSKVLVAADDQQIVDEVINNGGQAVLTGTHHQSGSDRIAEAAQGIDADIIVNVQGDEPFIDKNALASLLNLFNDPNVQVGSLMHTISAQEALNPNSVKVVCAQNGNALYFSRSVIPYNRDNQQNIPYYKHVGVYAYRPAALQTFVQLPPSPLEQTEKLEQLRLLQNGINIKMALTSYRGIGIDTIEDLEKARAILHKA